MNSALEINNVTKRIGEKLILDNVTLRIGKGRFMGIVGPNGAGKTTLLKVITQLILPSRGEVVFGSNGNRELSKLLEQVGSLIESPEYFDFLTCREILTVRCRVKGIGRRTTDEEVLRVSKLCGITGYLDRKCGYLSTGMRQKLALAVAFVGNPPILVLDEPLSGIDLHSANEILAILKSVKDMGETTAVVTFHEMEEILDLMDDVAFMVDGKVAQVISRDMDNDYFCLEAPEKPAGYEADRVSATSDKRGVNWLVRVSRNNLGGGIPADLLAIPGLTGLWHCNPIEVYYRKFLAEYYGREKQ